MFPIGCRWVNNFHILYILIKRKLQFFLRKVKQEKNYEERICLLHKHTKMEFVAKLVFFTPNTFDKLKEWAIEINNQLKFYLHSPIGILSSSTGSIWMEFRYFAVKLSLYFCIFCNHRMCLFFFPTFPTHFCFARPVLYFVCKYKYVHFFILCN